MSSIKDALGGIGIVIKDTDGVVLGAFYTVTATVLESILIEATGRQQP